MGSTHPALNEPRIISHSVSRVFCSFLSSKYTRYQVYNSDHISFDSLYHDTTAVHFRAGSSKSHIIPPSKKCTLLVKLGGYLLIVTAISSTYCKSLGATCPLMKCMSSVCLVSRRVPEAIRVALQTVVSYSSLSLVVSRYKPHARECGRTSTSRVLQWGQWTK